jgi:tetratricopeptide (TPR) repeat protein
MCEENGDQQGLANALRSLGHLASRHGDWEEAERCYHDALALAEETGDRRSYAASLRGLARLAVSRYGALAEARAYLERSKAIAEEIGAHGLLLGNLHSLSSLACQEGAYDEAEAYQKQALALCGEYRDPIGLASAQARLAYVLVLQGRKDAGWAALLQDLQDSTAPGMSAQAVSGIIAVAGQIGVHLERFQRAAELLGLGFGLDPTRSDNETFAEPQLNVLRATLGAQELEAALARGATLDPAQVVAGILACDTPEAFWGAGGDETPPA